MKDVEAKAAEVVALVRELDRPGAAERVALLLNDDDTLVLQEGLEALLERGDSLAADVLVEAVRVADDDTLLHFVTFWPDGDPPGACRALVDRLNETAGGADEDRADCAQFLLEGWFGPQVS